MCRDMVNNRAIKLDFEKMLKGIDKTFRTIIILAETGKGKSTVVNYLCDYCNNVKTARVLIDFKLFKSIDELDMLDFIINSIRMEIGKSNIFNNYKNLLKSYTLGTSNSIIIENTLLANTSIGEVKIDDENIKSFKKKSLINTFCDDYKKIKKNIVLLFDHFESASPSIQELILKKFIILNQLGFNTFFVIASNIELDKDGLLDRYQSIKKYKLPQVYAYEDWKIYCNEVLLIDDYKILNSCYECWKDNPGFMQISLKPFIGSKNRS